MDASRTLTRQRKLFLVDDDPASFDSVKHLLRDSPFDITYCQSSDEAIDRVQDNHYDVFFIDYMIDQRDGINLFQHIKPNLQEECNVIKPAILLTGYSDQDIAIKAMQAGFADMLPKDRLSKSSITRILTNTIEKYQLNCEAKSRQIELKRINEELSQKNAEITSFYQTISHELKTPLTSINEYIALFLDGYMGALSDDHKEVLSIVHHNCQLMRLFINDLLEVGRIETDKFTINKNRTVIDDIINMVIHSLEHTAKDKKIKLTYQARNPDIVAMLDENRLFQVISNLVTNAIKFSHPDTSVEIVSYLDDSNQVVISVRDHGCGIEPRFQQKIFDRLFQVKLEEFYHEKGLGLGLSICKEIIERHCGRIWVESEEGKGSNFFIQFPQS